MRKTLIACYSHTGITMALARALAVKTGFELFKINPANTYPKGFLACVFALLVDKLTHHVPLVMGKPQNLDSYDRVILCFPIWGGTIPPVVESFLKENDLSGKFIIPVCTYKRSSGHCDKDIRELCQNSTICPVIEATRFKNNAVSTIYEYITNKEKPC